eukprot:2751833-Pyramimonas_sp.AAC.1
MPRAPGGAVDEAHHICARCGVVTDCSNKRTWLDFPMDIMQHTISSRRWAWAPVRRALGPNLRPCSAVGSTSVLPRRSRALLVGQTSRA